MSYHKSYYGTQCKRCGTKVELDDIEYNFAGNQNEWLYCPKCNEWIIIKVRYGKICKVNREKGDE